MFGRYMKSGGRFDLTLFNSRTVEKWQSELALCSGTALLVASLSKMAVAISPEFRGAEILQRRIKIRIFALTPSSRSRNSTRLPLPLARTADRRSRQREGACRLPPIGSVASTAGTGPAVPGVDWSARKCHGFCTSNSCWIAIKVRPSTVLDSMLIDWPSPPRPSCPRSGSSGRLPGNSISSASSASVMSLAVPKTVIVFRKDTVRNRVAMRSGVARRSWPSKLPPDSVLEGAG